MNIKQFIVYNLYFLLISTITYGMDTTKCSIDQYQQHYKKLKKYCVGDIPFNESDFVFLLKSGVEINKLDEEGHALLYNAAKYCNYSAVKSLLSTGANVNILSLPCRQTPLLIAGIGKEEKIVNLLLRYEADPTLVDSQGVTSLSALSYAGKDRIIRILLQNKFVLGKIGLNKKYINEALLFASQQGHLAVVSLLLGAGAEVNHRSTEEIKNTNESAKYTSLTSLHWASAYGYTKIVIELVKSGADLEAKSIPRGETPLCFAVYRGHMDIVKILLKAGANVNAKTDLGETPISGAIAGEQLSIVEYLSSYPKIDMSLNNIKGCTLLGRSIMTSDVKFLIAILKHCEIDQVDDNGLTALHIACALGKYLFVKVLLQSGASNVKRLGNKFTPFDIAQDYGHEDIAAYIKAYSQGKTEEFNLLQSVQKELDAKNLAKENTRKHRPSKIVKKMKNVVDNEPTVKTITVQQDNEDIKKEKVFKQKCIAIADYDRKDKGGYCNEIFLFNSKQQGNFFCDLSKQSDVVFSPITKLDNIGSQLPNNPLAKLIFSRHVQSKMNNLRDNFHAFTTKIEEHGALACTKVSDVKLTLERKAYLKKEFGISNGLGEYWFELIVEIPGQIRCIGYQKKLAKQEGPLGNFCYIILKKSLSDLEGLCIHRCFERNKLLTNI